MLSGLFVALIFVILTPLIWRRLVETIEKVGWTSGIIAAIFTLLPFSIQDLPTGWKFVPIIIAAIILSATAYLSRRQKSRTVKLFSKSSASLNSNTQEEDVIRHYTTRDELKFHHMLSIAHDSVEMLASTFTIVTEQYYDELNYALNKGISLTFLLLDPDSKETGKQRGLYHRSDDLKYQIRNSLKVLCNLKRKFPDKIIIKLYDARVIHSITVIDRKNSDNAWIRVERRELDSVPNSRPSDAWFRREEEARFDNFLREYEEVLSKSNDYICPSTS